jgi:predicted homoserine dehydrogenase-like protein
MPVSPLVADLARRADSRGPVTIGLAGAGQMGTDIVVQVALMPGLRIGAIAEVRPGAARAAALLAGHAEDDVVACATASAIDRAIERGATAITDDPAAMLAAGRIDVVIDATGNPNVGSEFAFAAIRHGKHVVMLNVEADITIGRLFRQRAAAAGLVYTGAAGDEPACTVEVIGFAESLGLDVVCAGKGKNNPLDIDAVPADYEAEARARDMNPRMLVEFVDGSKTMIEMVAVANATGLTPDVPGMHGPAAGRDDLDKVLVPREHGGVLTRRGCVDYSVGKGVAPGVFAVVEARHPRIRERLADLKVGKGPFFTIYRPYHLTSIEVPLSAARAVLYGRADLVPLDRPVAEASAVAKRALSPGERLGKIGESDYRAFAVTAADAAAGGALPVGLAENAVVTGPVRAGERLTSANCRADETMLITRLRAELDASDRARAAAAE